VVISRKLFVEMLRFGIVGAIGFCVDAVVLYILIRWQIDPLLARVVSFPTALLATWLLNSRWTFGDSVRQKSRTRQAFGYVAVQCGGMSVNYMVFALALPLTGKSSLGVILALVLGSAAGLMVNFLGSRMLVFKPRASTTSDTGF
jgi:putative flippase GtrA